MSKSGEYFSNKSNKTDFSKPNDTSTNDTSKPNSTEAETKKHKWHYYRPKKEDVSNIENSSIDTTKENIETSKIDKENIHNTKSTKINTHPSHTPEVKAVKAGSWKAGIATVVLPFIGAQASETVSNVLSATDPIFSPIPLGDKVDANGNEVIIPAKNYQLAHQVISPDNNNQTSLLKADNDTFTNNETMIKTDKGYVETNVPYSDMYEYLTSNSQVSQYLSNINQIPYNDNLKNINSPEDLVELVKQQMPSNSGGNKNNGISMIDIEKAIDDKIKKLNDDNDKPNI